MRFQGRVSVDVSAPRLLTPNLTKMPRQCTGDRVPKRCIKTLSVIHTTRHACACAGMRADPAASLGGRAVRLCSPSASACGAPQGPRLCVHRRSPGQMPYSEPLCPSTFPSRNLTPSATG